MADTTSILDVASRCDIVLCAGPGGVGKTTSAAALALASAQAGQKVLVLTIDPARRLADALGIALDNEPRRIPAAHLAASGVEMSGELWALMLDAPSTLSALMRELAPTKQVADTVLNNPIYREIANALAGTLEFTAVERLYSLHSTGDFDLIVVDTPPSKNVLDFIEAPEYMARFFDRKIIKWFLMLDPTKPGGGLTRSLLKRTGRVVWEVLSRILGGDFLGDIIEFMHAIETMTDEIRRRSAAMGELLTSERSTFLIVSTTDPLVIEDAAHLRSEIQSRHIPFGGFVINRVRDASGIGNIDAVAQVLKRAGGKGRAVDDVVAKIVKACKESDREAEQHASAMGHLRQQSGWRGLMVSLPRQTDEIHDLISLDRLAARLA